MLITYFLILWGFRDITRVGGSVLLILSVCFYCHGGVQHIVRCVLLCLVHPMLPVSLDCLRPVSCVPYVTSFSGLSSSCVLCTLCYQFHWIVFVLCLVYPMLPVSLECLRPVSCVPYVTSFSGLSSFCVLCSLCYQFLWIVHL
jgi:hypothetical protein